MRHLICYFSKSHRADQRFVESALRWLKARNISIQFFHKEVSLYECMQDADFIVMIPPAARVVRHSDPTRYWRNVGKGQHAELICWNEKLRRKPPILFVDENRIDRVVDDPLLKSTFRVDKNWTNHFCDVHINETGEDNFDTVLLGAFDLKPNRAELRSMYTHIDGDEMLAI